MSNLNEVSAAIGRLEATQEHQQETTKDILIEMKKINEKMSSFEAVANDVTKMKPAVEELTRLKAKGAYTLMGIGIGAGGLGAALKDTLAKFF
ncbi:MAG: DUF1515 family protein [Halopseudomonas aestusnigri]